MKNRAIISLADSKYFELLNELIDSILSFKESESVSICILDAGLQPDQIKILEKKLEQLVEIKPDTSTQFYSQENRKGLLWYAEGPENGEGYSFWIDEVKFEKLGTISDIEALILEGDDKVITSFNGVQTTIDGVSATFNFTDQISQTISISPAYLNFSSSNTSVATVDEFELDKYFEAIAPAIAVLTSVK